MPAAHLVAACIPYGCSLHSLRLQPAFPTLQVGPGAARFKAEIHFNPQLLSERSAPEHPHS